MTNIQFFLVGLQYDWTLLPLCQHDCKSECPFRAGWNPRNTETWATGRLCTNHRCSPAQSTSPTRASLLIRSIGQECLLWPPGVTAPLSECVRANTHRHHRSELESSWFPKCCYIELCMQHRIVHCFFCSIFRFICQTLLNGFETN